MLKNIKILIHSPLETSFLWPCVGIHIYRIKKKKKNKKQECYYYYYSLRLADTYLATRIAFVCLFFFVFVCLVGGGLYVLRARYIKSAVPPSSYILFVSFLL